MTITLANGTTVNITPSDGSYREAQLMGDDYVDIKFESPQHIEIAPGSSMTFNGSTYWVEMSEDVNIVHRRDYEYSCRFYSAAERLKHIIFVNPDDGRTQFSITGNAQEHLSLLVRSANMHSPVTWSVGQCVTSAEMVTSYDGSTLWDALNLMAEKFGTETEITAGYAINLHFVQYNNATPLGLSYGKGNGLLSGVRRTPFGDVPPVAALVIKGSDRNINTSSVQTAYGGKTLHMPFPMVASNPREIPFAIGYDGERYAYSTGYVSTAILSGYQYDYPTGWNDATAEYFIAGDGGRTLYRAGRNGFAAAEPVITHGKRMEVIDLSDIYPHAVLTVTGVTTTQVAYSDNTPGTYTQYSVTVSTNIDYSSLKLTGKPLCVIFQSGMLAGKDFSAAYTHSTHKFTLEARTIDDELMPNATFCPVTGDTFIVVDCQMPYEYIRDDSGHSGAEWDLARAAVASMYGHGECEYSWTGDISSIFAGGLSAQNFAKLRIGGYISLTDEAVHPSPALIRITAIKQNVNNPKEVRITLSDVTEFRRRWRRGLVGESAQRAVQERTTLSGEAMAETLLGTATKHYASVTAEQAVEDGISGIEQGAYAEVSLSDEAEIKADNIVKTYNVTLKQSDGKGAEGKVIVLKSGIQGVKSTVVVSNPGKTQETVSILDMNGEPVSTFNTFTIDYGGTVVFEFALIGETFMAWRLS